MADEVLQQGVRGITDLMVMPGLINLDFADVRSVMGEMGKAMMGTGEAEGDNRAIEAAEKAISNPLLDGVSMKGAKGVIISITGGEDMRLMEVDEAASHIKELVDPDANIIWGSAFNNDLGGKLRVSVVATGIEAETVAQPQPGKVFTFPRDRGDRGCLGQAGHRGNAARPRRAPLELGSRRGQRRVAARHRRHLDQPGRRAPIVPPEDDEPTARTTQRSGRRRHLVRAHVEHRPRRAQGPARRRGRGAGLQARADRHPALPQPPEQPVGSSIEGDGAVPTRGCPIFLRISDPILPAHPPLGTVHRKPLGRKVPARFLRNGEDDAGTDARHDCGLSGALCGVAALAAAQPALAQARYGYALAGERLPRRWPATSARSPRARRISALWSGQAKPRSRSATPRPRPASSPALTRSIRAARCPRPGWARCRSPMARRRRRCPISPAPCSSARRRRRSAATAASPTICSASRPRPRPIIAPRSTAPTPTRRGAGWRSAWRSAATRPERSRCWRR